MKYIKRIVGSWTNLQVQILRQYGIDIKEGFAVKVIDEDVLNRNQELLVLLRKWDVLDKERYVVFDKKEIMSSVYCTLCGTARAIGYPMPSNDFGYMNLTYSLSDYCQCCGVGHTQKDDFRLAKIPKASFFSLGWVFDELFADKTTYENVFKPFGVACRSVRLYKNDKVIDSVVQLVIPTIEEKTKMGDLEYTVCPKCGRVKYHPGLVTFPSLHANPIGHMYKTFEWFGSGAEAHKKIYISAQLRDRMMENKIAKYWNFLPTRSDV